LFLYLDGARVGLTGYPLFGVRVAVTVVVASASFYLLEDRIRRGTFLRGWRGSLAPPVAVASVVVALCTATAAPALADGNNFAPRSTGRTVVFTKPPVKVLWVGDSAAFTLAIALSAEQRSYGFESFDGAILGCGVTNGAEFQLANVDAPMATQCRGGPGVQWPRLWLSDLATYRPDVVVLLAGRWEVVNRTYDGRWTNIEDPAYASYVKHQLEYATAVAGSGGAHVILMTAPCYATGEQPDGGPWPEDSPTRLSIYNQLVRLVAATTPNASLLDFNPMVCPGGRYEQFINGVQVRQPDGVHFALGAGSVLAQKFWPVVAASGSRRPPFSVTYGSRTQTSPGSESLKATSGR
jgi:hypothetical protein